jgi:hypothetical protein
MLPCSIIVSPLDICENYLLSIRVREGEDEQLLALTFSLTSKPFFFAFSTEGARWANQSGR